MNLLKLYESYQTGFLFGQKYPGVVKAIFRIIKGILLLCSFGIWQGYLGHGFSAWNGETAGGKAAMAAYCIVVWGGIVGLMVLKAVKNIDTLGKFSMFKIYHWVILVVSLIFHVILAKGEFAFYVIPGLLVGYLCTPLPELGYIFAEAFVNKIKKMKEGR